MAERRGTGGEAHNQIMAERRGTGGEARAARRGGAVTDQGQPGGLRLRIDLHEGGTVILHYHPLPSTGIPYYFRTYIKDD
jgi:hypothetical protein